MIEGWRKAHNVAQENEITSQDTLMQNVRKENEDRQQKAELYKSQIEEAKESLAVRLAHTSFSVDKSFHSFTAFCVSRRKCRTIQLMRKRQKS